MPRWLMILTRAAACLGWLLCIVDTVPVVGDLTSDAAGRLGLLLAGVGTLALVLDHVQRLPSEIYTAGKLVGRVEALTEHDDDDMAEVLRLADHRH